MNKVELKVDWCEYKAAEYAVIHWHYSKVMPSGKLVKVGAWENGLFIGCVIFGRGGTYTIGEPYGLKQVECCELVRVALNNHVHPTSEIVSSAIGFIKKQSPGLRLIVSYADSKEGHNGTIYQAMNWVYEGGSVDSWIKVRGALKHRRSLTSLYGTNSLEWLQKHVDPNAERVIMPPKHKYLYPLDRAMRKQIAPLAKPYPKREHAGEVSKATHLDTIQESEVRSLTSAFD